jgi:hypothetical protein
MVGEVASKFLGDLGKRVKEDLQNFKAYAEGMPERTASGKR